MTRKLLHSKQKSFDEFLSIIKKTFIRKSKEFKKIVEKFFAKKTKMDLARPALGASAVPPADPPSAPGASAGPTAPPAAGAAGPPAAGRHGEIKQMGERKGEGKEATPAVGSRERKT